MFYGEEVVLGPSRLESGPAKKYRNFYRKFNVKNIGIYRNFSGKYRINIGIFKAISKKKT